MFLWNSVVNFYIWVYSQTKINLLQWAQAILVCPLNIQLLAADSLHSINQLFYIAALENAGIVPVQ